MTEHAPSMGRRFLAGAACLAGTGFFIAALTDLTALASSAGAFRLHHEVTTPLCYLLAKYLVALMFGSLALSLLGSAKTFDVRFPLDLAALGFVAVLLVITGRVLANEAYFTLYDNTRIPVHPTEIVMHPYGGWMSAGDHLALCLLGLAGGLTYLLLDGRKRCRG